MAMTIVFLTVMAIAALYLIVSHYIRSLRPLDALIGSDDLRPTFRQVAKVKFDAFTEWLIDATVVVGIVILGIIFFAFFGLQYIFSSRLTKKLTKLEDKVTDISRQIVEGGVTGNNIILGNYIDDIKKEMKLLLQKHGKPLTRAEQNKKEDVQQKIFIAEQKMLGNPIYGYQL